MPDPIILPILLLTGAGLVGREVIVGGGGPTPPSDGKWTFPVPSWRGYAPTRSQEYRVDNHHGNDLMFRRKIGGADQMWPAGTKNGTARWFCPDSIYACAARDGTLWHVGEGGHGKFVVIDHGSPFATFYTHLSSLLFPTLTRGANSIRVTRGQPLGVIGYSPLDTRKLMHLHFEIWYKGGAGSHVDPWPILATAPLPKEAT